MKRLLITLKDKTRVDELLEFGNILYVSEYTNLIGFECDENVIPKLERHSNIVELEDARTGSLQN